ncbi:MAG: 1-acyl-sn-glycerol-3-phosphate acyltransferase [Oceanospirillaceae bacterium]|nr:1-acyl-sn-glycerol-3-phosphate acyltransferase [Oceanospirillaceae bacterium]
MKPEVSTFAYKKTLIQPVIGLVSFVFMCINVFCWALLVHLIAPLLLLKRTSYESFAERCVNRLYDGWLASCEWWFRHVLGVRWELDDTMQVDFEHWHLIIANHRSWVDVFVIFAQLKGRRPLPRVFMKQALIWMPFVGTATYIMGFPFMKRYTKEQVKKNPKLAGKDLATTKRSCKRLLNRPNSIMSFVEGTRFSPSKHEQQSSPYQCLLKPKAGGIGFILQTMPRTIKSITDINVLYEQETVTGWDLLCGRIGKVKVMVREVALPESILAPDYRAAEKDREHFFTWFNLYWHDKDVRMKHQLERLRQPSNKGVEQNFAASKTSQE